VSEREIMLAAQVVELERWIDCGQDGPCAKAPGCNRHWEERNGELVREVRDLQSQLEAKEKRVAELEEATDLTLAKAIVSRLNNLLRSDPSGEVRLAVTRVLTQRVEVSKVVGEHPTLQLTDDNKLGPLGLINGLVGVIPTGMWEGWGYIAAELEEEGVILRFCLTPDGCL
jgi:hypothetical protein